MIGALSRRSAILAALAVSWAAAAGAQVRSVELRMATGGRRLEWTRLLSLGDEARGQVGSITGLVRDSRGRYIVATDASRSAILVFDSLGAHAGTFGRGGQGPGEFGWAAGLALGAGDTLHVLDPENHRWTVLSPGFTYVRSASFGSFSYDWDQIVLDSQRLVISMDVGTEAAAGFPLHLFASDGAIVRSFGASRGDVYRRDLPGTIRRKISAAATGGVWSARINEYRIERYDTRGTLVARFTRQVPWFQPWLEAYGLSPERRPRSEVVRIHEDRSGLLWVLVRVAATNWRRGLEQASQPRESDTSAQRMRIRFMTRMWK